MSNAANNQASNVNVSVEETVAKLNTVCHVCEVKAPWALVHASPANVARIVSELGLSVHPSKKGGDYYAVKIAASVPAPRHLSIAPVAPAAPVAAPAPVRPAAPAMTNGTCRVEMKGQDYIVRETNPKRKMDSRRFEVRKMGDEIGTPYVVSFQSHDGCEAQCSCPDWIYRRRQCKHITGIQAAFAKPAQIAASNVA